MIQAYSQKNYGSFSSGALIHTAYVEYKIKFVISDTTYVWARANHSSGSDDSYHAALFIDYLMIDTLSYVNFEGAVGDGDWLWMNHHDSEKGPAEVNIPAVGIYSFRVYVRESGFNLDKIIMTINPDYIPDGYEQEETLPPQDGINEALIGNPSNIKTYPNPFSANTTIKYFVEKPGFVNIKAFNIYGQEVSRIFSGFQNKGDQSLEWNGTNSANQLLPNGVYFIQYQFKNDIDICRTVILR